MRTDIIIYLVNIHLIVLRVQAQQCDRFEYLNGSSCVACGNCLLGSSIPCNAVTGMCLHGCKNGYRPPLCKEKCTQGQFGHACQGRCTQCLNSECAFDSGICRACPKGYIGVYCRSECPRGTYGTNCSEICNGCLNNECSSGTGNCLKGCVPGLNGDKCDTVCEPGQYGPGCQLTCGRCRDAACNPVDGQCFGECLIGYDGPFCNKTCDDTSTNSSSCRLRSADDCGRDCQIIDGVCNCFNDLQTTSGQTFTYGIIYGVIIGVGIMGLILIISVCILCRSKRRLKSEKSMMKLESVNRRIGNTYVHTNEVEAKFSYKRHSRDEEPSSFLASFKGSKSKKSRSFRDEPDGSPDNKDVDPILNQNYQSVKDSVASTDTQDASENSGYITVSGGPTGMNRPESTTSSYIEVFPTPKAPVVVEEDYENLPYGSKPKNADTEEIYENAPNPSSKISEDNSSIYENLNYSKSK